jgi:predicted MPP superfamily phosphohydrolase
MLGLEEPLHIREERIRANGDACRLLYVSDIHLRGSRAAHLSGQVVRASRARPLDAVLLGGDLVDDASQLDNLRLLVRELSAAAPVFAVGGNHDCAIGLELVRDAVLTGGGGWIHGTWTRLSHGSRTIVIAGPEASAPADGDCRILCAHNPRIWKAASRSGYHLVLTGHLHGCQFVAFEFRGRLFPGALLYPCCYLSRQYRSSRLVVSRGVSDLFPIRWRCPREVVLCHV